MVLPPYVYSSDWREMRAHISAILQATPLSAMLYNNPDRLQNRLSPRADRRPRRIKHQNLHAVKESSADIRRVAAIRSLLGDRLSILVGVDDAIVEGIVVPARLDGSRAWSMHFPAESVALFDLAHTGRQDEAFELYRWFLPLLRMDTVPKFVQLIKYVQQEARRRLSSRAPAKAGARG